MSKIQAKQRLDALKNKNKGREYRHEAFKKERHENRTKEIDKFRNIQVVTTTQKAKNKKSRVELLKEWKELKEKEADKLKKNKKPPFIVGKVHHIASGNQEIANMPTTLRKGVSTRSRTKAINNEQVKRELFKLDTFAKVDGATFTKVENHKFQAPKGVSNFNFPAPRGISNLMKQLTIPTSPNIRKSSRKQPEAFQRSMLKQSSTVPRKRKTEMSPIAQPLMSPPEVKSIPTIEIAPIMQSSVSPSTHSTEVEQLKPSSEVKRLFASPDEAQQPKQRDEILHLHYSPFVEKRRGSTGRRSRKLSFGPGEIDVHVDEEEMIDRSRIAGFRLFLRNDTSRLMALAESWSITLGESSNIPTNVEGEINSVVGKTKLLTSDKFKQFESLIEKCENGDASVKVDDLEGFKDWVMIEVEELDRIYHRLDVCKQNQWIWMNEVPTLFSTLTIQEEVPKKKARKPVTAKVKPPAASGLRAHILAARKRIQPSDVDGKTDISSPKTANVSDASSRRTPLKTIINHTLLRSSGTKYPRTPREEAILRNAVNRRSSGIEMMAATNKAKSLTPGKSPTVDRLQLITPSKIDSDRSPAKSILRRTPLNQSARKTVVFAALDPKYLMPAEDSEAEDTPEVINMASTVTPLSRSKRHSKNVTPFRRSERLAQRLTKTPC